MQELRDGTSSARTVREREDEEAEAQGCGSVRALFHWGKAGNSPRFSRLKPLKNGFVLLLLFTSNLKAKGCTSASQNRSGRNFVLSFGTLRRPEAPHSIHRIHSQAINSTMFLSFSQLSPEKPSGRQGCDIPSHLQHHWGYLEVSGPPVVHGNCLSIACLLQGASSHPVLRRWTNSSWLHSTPKDFSSGEISHQRFLSLGKF